MKPKKPVKKSAKKKVTALAVVKQEVAVVKEKTMSLSDPEQVMQFANVLKSFITNNKLSTKIKDQEYCNVDGWKFAGLNFGLTAIPSRPVAKHKPGEYIHILYVVKMFDSKNGKYSKEVPVFIGFAHDKDVIEAARAAEKVSREEIRPYIAYECDCEIVKMNDQSIKLSRGTGFCSNMEILKSSFDEYAVISMCETRAIGKGYRNLIGFVVKAAGFETTPAEEMKSEAQETSYKEAETDLPIMTDEQFDRIMEKVMSGEWTVEMVKGSWTLGSDQEKAFKLAESKVKKS